MITGHNDEAGVLEVHEGPTKESVEIGLKSYGDCVEAEELLDTPGM